jgi:hypothetical protein
MLPKSPPPPPPPLSEAFSKARATAIISSGLLVLVNLGVLDLTKPIPLLNTTIANPQIAQVLLIAVAIYNTFRMGLEWFQSDPARRALIPSRLDLVVSVAIPVVALGWALLSPPLIQRLSRLPILPSLAIIAYGIVTEVILSTILYLLPTVRTREGARRLGLHRIPVALRAQLNVVRLWLVATLVLVLFARHFQDPLSNLWIFLAGMPVVLGLIGECISHFRPHRTSDGKMLSRAELHEQMRKAFEWHDAYYQLGGWDSIPAFEHSELYLACENGRMEDVLPILERTLPSCLNDPERHRWRPLTIAAANGHYEVAEALLKRGADPNVPNVHGRTPLAFAARYGNQPLVQLLLNFGADPNFCEGFLFAPALEAAANAGDMRVVELLLEAGANPSAEGRPTTTAVTTAEAAGNGEIAARLRRAIAERLNAEKMEAE